MSTYLYWSCSRHIVDDMDRRANENAEKTNYAMAIVGYKPLPLRCLYCEQEGLYGLYDDTNALLAYNQSRAVLVGNSRVRLMD